jgi:hypothetical protein
MRNGTGWNLPGRQQKWFRTQCSKTPGHVLCSDKAMAILCICWITLSVVLCVAVARAAARPLPQPEIREGTAASSRGHTGEGTVAASSVTCIRNSKFQVPPQEVTPPSALAPCGES